MSIAASTPWPQRWARIAGLLYLCIIVAGAMGEMFVRGTLVVNGDPAATAARIAADPGLWRLGIAGDLVMHVLDVPVMVVVYLLLREVDRRWALLALIANIVQSAVLVANKMWLLLPLFLLGDAPYLAQMGAQERNVLAYLAIRVHGHGFSVGLIFFGVACLIYGYLIRRSGFLPALIGWMLQLAGVCYLVNSFALLLSPPVQDRLFPWVLLPCLVAELAFALWLLVKGVDVVRWRERVAG
jgi:hypothetical protein